MVTVIIDEPMWFMGKALPVGSELVFSEADYAGNKANFKHHVKAKETDGKHTESAIRPS